MGELDQKRRDETIWKECGTRLGKWTEAKGKEKHGKEMRASMSQNFVCMKNNTTINK